jgi:hypothetical protein
MLFQHSIEGAFRDGPLVFLRLEKHHPPSPHISIFFRPPQDGLADRITH